MAEGVRIHLEKRIPLAAGLGGGSGNAATTLLGLNELFDAPLRPEQLAALAAALGSDVPFFLQTKPALATGRGEKIISLRAVSGVAGRGVRVDSSGLSAFPRRGRTRIWRAFPTR